MSNDTVVHRDEYFDLDMLSYSRLKDYSYSPMYYYKKYIDHVIKDDTSRSLDFGSILDSLLLSPQDFKKEYHIFEYPLTDAVKLICESFREDKIKGDLISVNNYTIRNKIKDLNLFTNITKDETLMRKIETLSLVPIVATYTSVMKRFIIDKTLYDQVFHLANKILTDAFIGEFFNDSYLQDQSTDVFNQFIYKFNYQGLNFKMMADKVLIDHKNKVILPMDLKSMQGNTSQFIRNYFKYRYDLQGFIYTKGIEKYRDEVYPDYRIDDFTFIVVSTTDNFSPPTLFPMVENAMAKAEFGTKVGGMHYVGAKDIVESLKWSMENDIWSYSKNHYENKGKQELIVQ